MSLYDGGASEINLQGFQIVRGQMFNRQSEPAMTMWYSSASFNTACYSALNDCTSIQMLVNSDEKKIIVRPCPSKDKDAVTWLTAADKVKYKKIECSRLTHQLFDLWGLKKDLRYRASGKLVVADQKVMLMFDFANCEIWRGQKMVNSIEV